MRLTNAVPIAIVPACAASIFAGMLTNDSDWYIEAVCVAILGILVLSLQHEREE